MTTKINGSTINGDIDFGICEALHPEGFHHSPELHPDPPLAEIGTPEWDAWRRKCLEADFVGSRLDAMEQEAIGELNRLGYPMADNTPETQNLLWLDLNRTRVKKDSRAAKKYSRADNMLKVLVDAARLRGAIGDGDVYTTARYALHMVSNALWPDAQTERRRRPGYADGARDAAAARHKKHLAKVELRRDEYRKRLDEAHQKHLESKAALSPKIIDVMAQEHFPDVYAVDRRKAVKRMRDEVKPRRMQKDVH